MEDQIEVKSGAEVCAALTEHHLVRKTKGTPKEKYEKLLDAILVEMEAFFEQGQEKDANFLAVQAIAHLNLLDRKREAVQLAKRLKFPGPQAYGDLPRWYANNLYQLGRLGPAREALLAGFEDVKGAREAALVGLEAIKRLSAIQRNEPPNSRLEKAARSALVDITCELANVKIELGFELESEHV